MFIIRENGHELTATTDLLTDNGMFSILDTDDCVVERLAGSEVLEIINQVKFENITTRWTRIQGSKLRRYVIQGIKDYAIKSILYGEVSIRTNKEQGIALYGSKGCKLVISCKDHFVTLNDETWMLNGSITLEEALRIYAMRIVWAERISKDAVRLVLLLQFKEEALNSDVRELLLFLVYAEGRFYIQKIRTWSSLRGTLKVYRSMDKAMQARLSLLPDYSF